jgi:NADPH:quinone reductase-like Zn-dependent oxidoreductase
LNPVLRLVITAVSAGIRKQAKKLGVRYQFLFMRASGEQLSQITDLIDSGALRPIVGGVHSFDQTPQALRGLGKGGIRGKAVISIP